jgi:hypothetical protein
VNINGRQIRNIVLAAESLALGKVRVGGSRLMISRYSEPYHASGTTQDCQFRQGGEVRTMVIVFRDGSVFQDFEAKLVT